MCPRLPLPDQLQSGFLSSSQVVQRFPPMVHSPLIHKRRTSLHRCFAVYRLGLPNNLSKVPADLFPATYCKTIRAGAI